MKIQDVIARAQRGEIKWKQAAKMLGMSPRSLRRWRSRYLAQGELALIDQRKNSPSPKAAPDQERERILALYVERYQGFNIRHFHELAQRKHGITRSYSFVKKILQQAGLVKKRKARGRHHK